MKSKSLIAVLLVSPAAFVPLAEAGAGGTASEGIHPGHYSGGGFPATPVDFGVSADRHKVKRFTTRLKLDCKQGRRFVGYLVLRRVVFKRTIPIQKTVRGGRFDRISRARFSEGGRLKVAVHGILIAPERARGNLRARARFPGDVVCRTLFGPIGWTARFVG